MTTTDKQTVQIIVDLCAQKGITKVVISPGSRNAPLSIAFNRNTEIETFVIVDERSAAFFALGMAQRLCQPVAIVCTSGTALLNYAPAVAEAFYQRIPLLVLSADRPVEWIEQDDSQAINQTNIFANFVKQSFQLPAEITCKDELWHTNRTVNEAINIATSGRKGPVHVNIPLREPLYTIVNSPSEHQRVFSTMEADDQLSEQSITKLRQKISNAPKILILAGFMANEHKDEFSNILAQIAKIENVVFFAEPISNIQHPSVISTIDRVLNVISVEEVEAFKPDLLISFGGALVSKQIKTFLKNNPPKEHWYIGKGETHIDTFQSLTELIKVHPVAFLNQFIIEGRFESNTYKSLWNNKLEKAKTRHNQFMLAAPWSDLKAFEIICYHLPANGNLQLGNSSAVRYAHLFEHKSQSSTQSNRGTSGIDGSTSTAVGAAWVSDAPTTLISGDLSFFYDSNALWNKYLSPQLKIIVMSNGGGSLFRFIPGPSEVEELDEFFEVAQHLDIEKLVATYGLNYLKAENESELKLKLIDLYSSQQKATVLEVKTPRTDNDKILKKYFQALKQT